MTGCVTPIKSKKPVWLHEQILACTPETAKFGLYRIIECKNKPEAVPCKKDPPPLVYKEFIPYCDEHVKLYLGVKAEDVPEILQ